MKFRTAFMLFLMPLAQCLGVERTGLAPLAELQVEPVASNLDQAQRYMGPIGAYATAGDTGFKAIRPLWSYVGDGQTTSHDFVWPLALYRDSVPREHWRFLLAYSYTNRVDSKESYGVIPFLFFKEAPEYGMKWGVFPLYGDLNDFIGYDRWNFALFPLYSSTEKLSKKSTSYLWPLINYEKGKDSERFRVLPFYAWNKRDGVSENQAWLWPFVTCSRSLKEGSGDYGWMVWPFVGYKQVGEESTWSYVWPLFIRTNDDEGTTKKANYLWPFYQYEERVVTEGLLEKREVNYYKKYYWPIWGEIIKGDKHHSFYAWPFGSKLEEKTSAGRVSMHAFLPFYFSKDSYDPADNQIEKYRKVWPFWSQTVTQEKTEMRILDLWPYRKMEQIERNWAPFWTLYKRVECCGESSWEALWGTVYHSVAKDGASSWGVSPFFTRKQWQEESKDNNSQKIECIEDDILCGLIRLRKTSMADKSIRLFWILEF